MHLPVTNLRCTCNGIESLDSNLPSDVLLVKNIRTGKTDLGIFGLLSDLFQYLNLLESQICFLEKQHLIYILSLELVYIVTL
jgi:hypothetical protein